MLPVLPSLGGFPGDLILLLALMEIPAICLIVAGFTSRSLFGEIGSAREAVLLVSYNLVFLLAAFSIAFSQHTFRLEALAPAPQLHGASSACLPSSFACPPGFTSIPSRCPTPSRKSTPDR